MKTSLATRISAVLLGALLAIPVTASAQERQYARCTAAERSAPTLNKTVFPTATFEMVEDVAQAGRGPGGSDLYYKHGVERLKLAEAVELEVNLTACNAHGNAYRFRIAKDNTATTETKYWLDKAVGLIALIEKGNTDGMVDLGAMKRALQSRAVDTKAAGFRDGSLDGMIPRGGGEDRGRISELYLVTINQRREDSTVVSVTYLIGPL